MQITKKRGSCDQYHLGQPWTKPILRFGLGSRI